MKLSSRTRGNIYEIKAMELLKSSSYDIIETNYRNRYGEIDIIAKKNDTLVFIEVKYRKNDTCGYSLEAVDGAKKRKIYNTAKAFIYKNQYYDYNIRFDCVSYMGETVSWEKNVIWGDELGI